MFEHRLVIFTHRTEPRLHDNSNDGSIQVRGSHIALPPWGRDSEAQNQAPVFGAVPLLSMKRHEHKISLMIVVAPNLAHCTFTNIVDGPTCAR